MKTEITICVLWTIFVIGGFAMGYFSLFPAGVNVIATALVGIVMYAQYGFK